MGEVNGVRVLERAISILSSLASSREPIGLSGVSRVTGLSKATAFRILSTLVEHDLVIKDAKGSYQTGPGVLAWASSFRGKSALIEIAHPFLNEISQEVFETVHLFLFEKGKAFYIDKFDSPQPVRLQAVVGGNPVLYCTAAGRAILASLPYGEFDAYLAAVPLVPLTRHTCTEPSAFLEIIEEARIKGFAQEDQENEDGIRCVGSAILRGDGYPVGAISITAPRYRFLDEMVEPFGQRARSAAEQISKHFGYMSEAERSCCFD